MHGRPVTLVYAGGASAFRLSTDAGSTWKLLDIPAQNWIQSLPTGNDVGGPFAAPGRTITAGRRNERPSM